MALKFSGATIEPIDMLKAHTGVYIAVFRGVPSLSMSAVFNRHEEGTRCFMFWISRTRVNIRLSILCFCFLAPHFCIDYNIFI